MLLIGASLMISGCAGNPAPSPQTPTDTQATSETPASTQEIGETQVTEEKGITKTEYLSLDDIPDVTITISKEGFTPGDLTIPAGTKVIFKNEDTTGHWPASDPHPTHGMCPYFRLDEAIAPGETGEVHFDITDECTFHDHLNPSLKGKFTIE